MRLSSKKGYIMAMAIYYVIIAALTSVGVYSYAYYISKEIKVDDVSHIKGYYSGMGGLRYASILLRDPTSATGFGFSANPPPAGQSRTITIASTTAVIGADLGLTGRNTLTITAAMRADGQYDVSATFAQR
jgi:hypothetical protein